mgnify:CR=1 FL=1
MPNILKHFLKTPIGTSGDALISSYIFPEAEKLELEQEVPEVLEPEKEETAGDPEETETAEKKEAVPAGTDVISFAAVQAKKIVEDAERQAEQLIEERQHQAEKEIEIAREEACSEGYRQGYAEGLSKAEIESRGRLDDQLQKQAEEISGFLKEAAQAKEDLIEQTKKELCDLSIAIAEKVIHISLKSSSEVIARMIQVVTEKMKRREWVHIYVGGVDAKDLAQITPELTVALAGLSDHIKIIPMADDEIGTCIVEMPDEIVDASVSTQLQNIREILHEDG